MAILPTIELLPSLCWCKSGRFVRHCCFFLSLPRQDASILARGVQFLTTKLNNSPQVYSGYRIIAGITRKLFNTRIINYIYISITSNITNVSQINYHGKIIIDQRIFAFFTGSRFRWKNGKHLILAEKKEKRKKINCSRLVSRLSLQDNFRHAHRLPRARTYTRTNYPKRHIRSRNAPLTIFRREDPSTLLFNRRGGENGKAGRFSRWSNNKTIS